MKCLTLFVFLISVLAISVNANKPNCQSCLTVAEIGKDILSSGISDDEIKKIGQFGCSLVPDIVKGVCPSLIDKVYKNLYEAVVTQNKTPKQICTEVKLC